MSRLPTQESVLLGQAKAIGFDDAGGDATVTIQAAVPGRRIIVWRFYAGSDTATEVEVKSGSSILAEFSIAAGGSVGPWGDGQAPLWPGRSKNEALTLNISATASDIRGWVLISFAHNDPDI